MTGNREGNRGVLPTPTPTPTPTHQMTAVTIHSSRHLWTGRKARGGSALNARFTRRTTSTAPQVAVDHAFTGIYVDHLRPNDPPEARRCPCGHPCDPLNMWHITATDMTGTAWSLTFQISHHLPFRCLVGPHRKDALRLLIFIQESHAFTRPETGPLEYIDPEPD